VSCATGGQPNSERRRWPRREASGAGGATLR